MDSLKEEMPPRSQLSLQWGLPRGRGLGLGDTPHLCRTASLQVRVRLELKSPVKTLEDFLRRFSPSRLTSGCSSMANLATAKGTPKSDSSSPSTDSTPLRPEDKPGRPAPAIASNGYGGGAAGRAADPQPELRYEAESPDEAALVYAARAYSCALADRLHDQVAVELPHLGRLTFELLHTLGFDSIRKRMSVVIRHPLTDEINVYTKGADSVVMDLLLPCASGTRPLPRAPQLPAEVPQTGPQAPLPGDTVLGAALQAELGSCRWTMKVKDLHIFQKVPSWVCQGL